MIGIGRLGKLVLIGLPLAWLGLFFLFPLLIVLKISLDQRDIRIPHNTSIFFHE